MRRYSQLSRSGTQELVQKLALIETAMATGLTEAMTPSLVPLSALPHSFAFPGVESCDSPTF